MVRTHTCSYPTNQLDLRAECDLLAKKAGTLNRNPRRWIVNGDCSEKLVGAVGIGLKAMLKTRNLLIPLDGKNAKNTGFAQSRYTAGTRSSQPKVQTATGHSQPAGFLLWYLNSKTRLPSVIVKKLETQRGTEPRRYRLRRIPMQLVERVGFSVSLSEV
jgi:hypothetical protein